MRIKICTFSFRKSTNHVNLQAGYAFLKFDRPQFFLRELFTWREEHHRRRNSFSLALLACGYQVEKEWKMAFDKNKHAIWTLLLPLLALTTTFQQQLAVYQLVVTQNDFIHLNCPDYPLTRLQFFGSPLCLACVAGVWKEGKGSFRHKRNARGEPRPSRFSRA